MRTTLIRSRIAMTSSDHKHPGKGEQTTKHMQAPSGAPLIPSSSGLSTQRTRWCGLACSCTRAVPSGCSECLVLDSSQQFLALCRGDAPLFCACHVPQALLVTRPSACDWRHIEEVLVGIGHHLPCQSRTGTLPRCFQLHATKHETGSRSFQHVPTLHHPAM